MTGLSTGERRKHVLTDEDLDQIVEHVNNVGVRLTDNDVEKLATALEVRILKRFYLNVGKGVLGLAWKGTLIILLFLAAYGNFGKVKFWG